MRKFSSFLIALLLFSICATAQQWQTFTNPLLPSGPDPYSFYKDGFYYYTNTLGNRLGIWKTKNLADLKTAEYKTIYTPPAGMPYSKDLWAPEILFLQGKWYCYFAADAVNNKTHRMFVLENASADPMTGEWILKGQVSDVSNKWAIDGDVFEFKKQLYMVWSGWEGDVNGQQNIYIAKMKNPWTIESERVRISYPQHDWEKIGDLKSETPPHINVNEGPQGLVHGNDLFVVYSASACWTDFYALGLLRFTGGNNLLDSSKWQKGRNLFSSNHLLMQFLAPGIIRFLYRPTEKKTGYSTMPIATRAMVAAIKDRPGRKNLAGRPMVRLISENL